MSCRKIERIKFESINEVLYCLWRCSSAVAKASAAWMATPGEVVRTFDRQHRSALARADAAPMLQDTQHISSRETYAMRVLVIEDNPKMAEAIQNGLREHGYAADVSHSGFEGEELASSNAHDVILLDVMLPDR